MLDMKACLLGEALDMDVVDRVWPAPSKQSVHMVTVAV